MAWQFRSQPPKLQDIIERTQHSTPKQASDLFSICEIKKSRYFQTDQPSITNYNKTQTKACPIYNTKELKNGIHYRIPKANASISKLLLSNP